MSEQNKISGGPFELAPCYGRDYKNRKDVEAGFRAGQDFEGDYQLGFKPVGIQDFAPGACVNLRYSMLTKVAVVRV